MNINKYIYIYIYIYVYIHKGFKASNLYGGLCISGRIPGFDSYVNPPSERRVRAVLPLYTYKTN